MNEVNGGRTFAVEPEVARRLSEHAIAEGLSLEDAFAVALHIGLELCERGRIDRATGLEQLQREVDELRSCLHVLGPAAFGTNLLLLHWATASGSLKVSGEELSREFKAVARMEWALEMARRGILPTGSDPDEGPASADTETH